MKRLLTVPVLALAFLFGAAPLPAQAAGPVVWVDVSVNKAWPLARAVKFVDGYTGSTLKVGRCRSGAKCIRIREARDLPASWAGATYPGNPLATIKLAVNRRGLPSGQRLGILVHELAHANGVYTHNRACNSVMYSSVRCPNGRTSPLTFTATERAVLARN